MAQTLHTLRILYIDFLSIKETILSAVIRNHYLSEPVFAATADGADGDAVADAGAGAAGFS